MSPATVPTSASTPAFDAATELDRQLDRLLELGYPELAGITADELRRGVQPLREPLLAQPDRFTPPTPQHVPFVLVVSHRLVPAERAMTRIERAGRQGFVAQDLADIARFTPIPDAAVPDDDVYLLLDVERGDEHLGRTPDEVLPIITGRGRSPLTYDEGIALATLFPESLEKNRCTMLQASRSGDRRVPALWISGGTGKDGRERRGAAKLGWCWAGNHHTWLGHASAVGRYGTGLSARR